MADCSLFQILETIKTNKDAIGILIDCVIGIALIALAFFSNRISKNQNNIARREVYLSVYDKLTEAIGLVFADGRVLDPAKNLFWQARDRARLELPKEIENYTQHLFDEMWEAYTIHYHKLYGDDPLPVGEERSEASRRHMEIISKLIKERPNQVFEKYLRIKT